MARMSYRTGIGAFVLGLFAAGSLTAQAQSIEARLNAILGNKQLQDASVGVQVVEITPSGPVEIFSHNSNTRLGPASCTKLITTAAAFETWGPQHGLKTQLLKVGEDLVILGTGDPGLGDVKIAEEHGEEITTPFDQFAQRLKALGITQVRHVLVDDRAFDQEFIHPDWPADQRLAWYQAPVGALNFNANCLDWIATVGKGGVGVKLFPDNTYVSVSVQAKPGKENKMWLWRPADRNAFEMRGTVASTGREPESVTIVDPGLWTGTVLRDRLVAGGITVSGVVKRFDVATTVKAELIAEHETKLIDVINRANRNSVNMMAETLCKRLGHAATRQPGTWDSGTAAVTAWTRSIGVQNDQIAMADGSGLSPKNRIAAAAFTHVLAHVAGRPDGELFVQSLAHPGEDGTLQKRFRGMSCAKYVHAKTGHIKGVSTLSGYVDAGKRRFAFSILCNKYMGNVNPLQDQIVQQVFDWAGGKRE